MPLEVPPPDAPLPGKQGLLVVPGGESQLPGALVDKLHGPSPQTGDRLVTQLGGPVTDMYEQTAAVHWQGNYYGYGSEQDLQGSPVPEYNMNTRKVLYAYAVDDQGRPKPRDADQGFRVFLMYDFLYWAEDPQNPYGCAAPASSAPHVDPAVRVPLWKTPMQLLHNWPRRRELPLIAAGVAVGFFLLGGALSHSWGKALLLGLVALLSAGLVAFGALLLTNVSFNAIQYCGFFDPPSCWTGLPLATRYEDAQDDSIYRWRSDRVRTFGGLPEIGASWGYQYRTRLLQYLLANGFCVVVPGFSNVKLSTVADPKALGALLPFKFDCQDWYWAPAFADRAEPAEHYASQNNGCAGGWPGPDAAMLVKLMEEMRKGSFFGLGSEKGKPHLNLDRLVLGGYSAGSQFVSRCINEFPDLTYEAAGQLVPFPPVRGAFLLSGGTYQCYTGPDSWSRKSNPQCARAPADCPIEPGKPDSPAYAELIGCCPAGVIEARYQQGPAVLKHPPVILCQTKNDSDADLSAHEVYAEALRAKLQAAGADPAKVASGVQTVTTCWTAAKCNGRPLAPPRQAQITLDDCSSHTWFPELIVPVAQFLTDVTEAAQAPAKGYFAKA